MEGRADAFSTEFDPWELKERRDKGELHTMGFDYSKHTFEHVKGAGYSPVHTVIRIPRNDGKGEFEIYISENLNSAEVKKYVDDNKGLINSRVSSGYKSILETFEASKFIRYQVIPYSGDYPEWEKIGEKETSHGKDIKLKKVNEHNLGKKYAD